ncbi:MAG: acyl-CoA dehydratase activase-related protein [candidate division WOR-3 bacterium]
MKVAFPYFGYDTPVLAGFLEDLGAEIVMPAPTSKRTLELGVRYSPELICMPFKLTLGNLLEAIEAGADLLFMAAGARKCRFGYYHYLQSKILKQVQPRCRLVPVGQYSPYDFFFRLMPEEFGVSPIRVIRATLRMFARSVLTREFRQLLNRKRAVDFEEAERLELQALKIIKRARSVAEVREARRQIRQMFALNGVLPDLKVGLVGEIFFCVEQSANQEIERELGRLGVEVIFERSLYHHLRHLLGVDASYFRSRYLARPFLRECPGGEAVRTVGEAIQFARAGVDGIIQVFPFTCMPENMALEVLQHVSREYSVPVLSLSFDEHTSRTGLVTRLEAFVELLRRRRRAGTGVGRGGRVVGD